MDQLLRVVSDHRPAFVAGLIVSDGRVKTAAPILKYMVGWPEDRVQEYAKKRKWRIETAGELKTAVAASPTKSRRAWSSQGSLEEP